jgi:hypothetical protein
MKKITEILIRPMCKDPYFVSVELDKNIYFVKITATLRDRLILSIHQHQILYILKHYDLIREIVLQLEPQISPLNTEFLKYTKNIKLTKHNINQIISEFIYYRVEW